VLTHERRGRLGGFSKGPGLLLYWAERKGRLAHHSNAGDKNMVSQVPNFTALNFGTETRGKASTKVSQRFSKRLQGRREFIVGPEPRDEIYDSSRPTTIFYVYSIGYWNTKTLSYGSHPIWHHTNSLIDLIHGDFIPFLLDTAP
jgi:hypothetical protein